jgi:RHS repeat-associated protein
MPGRTYNSSAYAYKFNGKRDDSEWNGNDGAMYDYGMRIYDPRIARFLSVDPLTAEYPWYTPYQFAGNKPIAFIDLDGLEETPLHLPF